MTTGRAAHLRTMPVSKHSHSGTVPRRRMAASIVLILSTGLSNSIGFHAHAPSLLVRR